MILLTLSHTAAYLLLGVTALIVGGGIGILLSSTVMRNALTKKSILLLEEAKEKAEVIKKTKSSRLKKSSYNWRPNTRKRLTNVNAKSKRWSRASNNNSNRQTNATKRSVKSQRGKKPTTKYRRSTGKHPQTSSWVGQDPRRTEEDVGNHLRSLSIRS